MRPEELSKILQRQPFIPFRIHLTDGKTYDIRHPENLMILRSRLDIAVDRDPATGVIGQVDFVSLLHLVRVEDVPAGVPQGGNGQTS
jgi:hypothetical protein